MTNPEETMEDRFFNFITALRVSDFSAEAQRKFLNFFKSELLLQHENDKEEFREMIQSMIQNKAQIDYTKMKGRVWNCVDCGESLKGRKGHPVRCLKCAIEISKQRQIAKSLTIKKVCSELTTKLENF